MLPIRWVSLCLLLLTFARSAAGQGKEPFRFLHIAHTRLTASGSSEPLRSLVTEINAMVPRPAFLVNAGDVTQAGRPEEFARFQESAVGLSLPIYATPGSRDTGSASGKGAFAQAFGRLYQSFHYGGCHFVLLDSTIQQERWGHLEAAQLKWLEDDLRKIKKGTPIFLFLHHAVGREKRVVDNEDDLLRAIAPHNVVAIFVGNGQADAEWKVNGIQCVMASGMQQGSYHVVEVGTEFVTIRRVQRGRASRPPQEVVTLPLAMAPRRRVAFGWDDINIPLLARRQFLAELRSDQETLRDARIKAEYSLDGGAFQPMERDTRVDPARRQAHEGRFIGRFETKGLGNGAHRLRVRLTAPDGETYQRDEPFIVEQVSGQPKRLWGPPFATGGAVQSSPALVGNTLYVTALDGKVYAIDATKGKRRWVTATKGPILASPVVADGALYVGSSDRSFYALDARSGRVRWRCDVGVPLFATAVVVNGLVCFGADAKIIALETATGKQRWMLDTGEVFSSPVAAAEGVLYFHDRDNALYALDAATGRPKWKVKKGAFKVEKEEAKGQESLALAPAASLAPWASEGRVYLCASDGTLHAVDARTGEDIWSTRAPQGGDPFGSAPLHADGRVYVSGRGPNGDCYALDAATGRLIWRCSTGAANESASPAIMGRLIVVSSQQGRLSWIDAATGQLRYQYATDTGFCFSAPACAEKTAYIPSMNGRVQAIQLP